MLSSYRQRYIEQIYRPIHVLNSTLSGPIGGTYPRVCFATLMIEIKMNGSI